MLRLNLGCSSTLEPGYVNVDIAEPADQIADLAERWPWDDSTVDFVRAHDIFEHIADKKHTLNELYRVLVPNGRCEMVVPTTDGRGAWQDVDHKSYWNPNSLFYLEYNNPHNTRFKAAYGMNHHFRIIEQKHEKLADEVWKLTAVLEAVK